MLGVIWNAVPSVMMRELIYLKWSRRNIHTAFLVKHEMDQVFNVAVQLRILLK
jgi:hypothetical protein